MVGSLVFMDYNKLNQGTLAGMIMHFKKGDDLFKNQWPVKDWLVSHIMLDLAVKSILSKVKLNRTHDIPYLAGYSRNGKTIYIDRHMPKSFLFKGRRIFTDRYLILHETLEKTLISQHNIHYQFAHQIALRAEEAAVRADKISWKAYDNFMQKYIKSIGDEKLKKVPRDLDVKPYRDENDSKLLKEMKKSMYKKS
jgi:hypothetical protein